MQRRQQLKKCKRIVVKVGTALLTNEQGVLDQRFIDKLAADIAELRKPGRQVILVSSGAIGAGITALQKKRKPRSIPTKQAMAAIGQPRLMQAYANAFGKQGLLTAQVLLTAGDIHHRKRYSHARNALAEILRLGVVPVFNENDTVAVDEIKFGNNDVLSAHVTHLAEADLLIILTDVAGLFSENPSLNPGAHLVSAVARIDERVERMAGGSRGSLGTGGMATKIMAAKMVTTMGEEVVIASGRQPDVLARIVAGEAIGTIFHAQDGKLSARKRWIAFAMPRQGSLILDPGAVLSVAEKGKSLLPSGITRVEGDFEEGDCVALKTPDGRAFAAGLSHYSSEDIRKLCGAKSSEIERILGRKTSDEIIHRDDLALLK